MMIKLILVLIFVAGISSILLDKGYGNEDKSQIMNSKNNELMEQRQQNREEMKFKMEKMREEMKACKDKVCRCEVKKKHQKSAIDNFKARIQEMEKKYRELDCSKK